eukprot:scaffold48708_cov63-Phaeocystis_antarctica.AAC.1
MCTVQVLEVDDVVSGALEQGQLRRGAGDDAVVWRPVPVEAADEARQDEDPAEGLREGEGVPNLGELVVDQREVLRHAHALREGHLVGAGARVRVGVRVTAGARVRARVGGRAEDRVRVRVGARVRA